MFFNIGVHRGGDGEKVTKIHCAGLDPHHFHEGNTAQILLDATPFLAQRLHPPGLIELWRIRECRKVHTGGQRRVMPTPDHHIIDGQFMNARWQSSHHEGLAIEVVKDGRPIPSRPSLRINRPREGSFRQGKGHPGPGVSGHRLRSRQRSRHSRNGWNGPETALRCIRPHTGANVPRG